MEGDKKNSFALILICIVLISVAGAVGYFSRSLIPGEIKSPTQNENVIKATSVEPSPEEQFDILKASLNTAAQIAQEAPRFFYLMGSKLLTPPEDTKNVSNVSSFVKNPDTEN